jgi:hypothetical protein
VARHLSVVAAALYVSSEAVQGSAYDPAVLDRLRGPRLDRACVERLKRSPLRGGEGAQDARRWPLMRLSAGRAGHARRATRQ